MITPPEAQGWGNDLDKGINYLISADEIITKYSKTIQNSDFEIKCIGRASEGDRDVFFLVVDSKDLRNIRKEIQLEQDTFDSCLINGKYIDEIKKDLDDGREYGVTGTPGFFVGNDEIGYVELKGAQPFDSFKKVIDAQLDA